MEHKKNIIDIENWNRKDTYRRFIKYSYPYLTICSEVDVSNILKYAQDCKRSFYGTFSWVILKAVNENPSFKLRIQKENVVEYNEVGMAFTALKVDKTYENSSIIKFNEDINKFLDEFEMDKKKIENNEKVNHSSGDDVIYISCTPEISVSCMINPMQLGRQDSIPRFFWGKYEKRNNRVYETISIQVHHSLADAINIAELVKDINNISSEFEYEAKKDTMH